MKTISRILAILMLAAMLAATAQCAENLTEKARIMVSEGIKTIQVGDIEMAYKVMGQGEPLVMIMGASATMDWWPPELLDNLSSKYRVIVFDNRGMGYSTASAANFSISQFANDTAGLMDALGIKQANVLGGSMGGLIAQELAIEHPEKVKRLILMATYCGGSQAIQTSPEIIKKTPDISDPSNLTRQELRNLSEIMYPKKWLAENPDFYNRSFWVNETSSPENVKRQAMAIYLWPGSYDRLGSIKVPTLIVAGTDDVLIPPENSLILASRINGSWLVRLENAGHGIHNQYPEKLARIVTDFIELSAADTFTQSLNASSVTNPKNSTEKARIMTSEGVETVSVGDIEMAYKVMGQGEPLVMITGAGGTMDWWPKELVDNLSSKYQVVIFDNRGMGYTTASPTNFSVSQFANDTAGLMDVLGIKQANILGVSMGTFIGQELAIDHPEKVKRLILVSGYCGGNQSIPPDPAVLRKASGLLDPANSSTQDVINLMEVMYPQKWLISHPDFYSRLLYNKTLEVNEISSPENIKRQSMALSIWPGTYDRLDRIKSPTLIVVGMEDIIFSPENSLIMANRINGSWLVRFENAGHGLFCQYPNELARIVTEFIELSATYSFAQPINSSSVPGPEEA